MAEDQEQPDEEPDEDGSEPEDDGTDPVVFLAPDTQAAIRRISREFARQIPAIESQLDNLAKAVAIPAAQATAALDAATAGWRAGLDEFYRSVAPKLPDFGEWARAAFRAFAENLPPNWGTDDWAAVIDLMEKTGWSLIWVPGPAVLSRLVEAQTGEEADELLVACADEVLVDVEACLADVQEPALLEAVTGLRDAVAAARHGSYSAAQALAASVLAGLVQDHEQTLSRARKKWESIDWLDAPMWELRRTGVWVAVSTALTNFSHGDPVPPRFNRHAVAHGFSTLQFTPANALAGILLTVSLTRELQESRAEDET